MLVQCRRDARPRCGPRLQTRVERRIGRGDCTLKEAPPPLVLTGSFRRNEDASLDCDLLVVDETSMVDVPLMRAVLPALPEGAALLLVGDVDQLPSVGPV